MRHASLFQLITLSAIWGASFIFVRVAVPALGPAVLIELRLLLAALLLWLAGRWFYRQERHMRTHWRHYLVLGLFNTALPFLLFAYAARTMPASLLAVLNATAPIWGTVIGVVRGSTAPSIRTILGLALGVAGVGLLVGMDRVARQPGAGWAIAAPLLAAFCYGLASDYAKSAPAHAPFANAHGSMWAGVILLAPLVPFFQATAVPGAGVLGAVLALGLLCTGVAYLLYFRLVADLGAAPALTVTFLIPVFGILWGHLFLGETVGWYTLAGTAVVLLGTGLVTGFSPRILWGSKAVQHG